MSQKNTHPPNQSLTPHRPSHQKTSNDQERMNQTSFRNQSVINLTTLRKYSKSIRNQSLQNHFKSYLPQLDNHQTSIRPQSEHRYIQEQIIVGKHSWILARRSFKHVAIAMFIQTHTFAAWPQVKLVHIGAWCILVLGAPWCLVHVGDLCELVLGTCWCLVHIGA